MPSGYTLTEMLIALALGLLLIGATLAMLIATKRTNAALDGIAQVQETGRFALYAMERDLRMAGYRGCGLVQEIVPLINPPAVAAAAPLYDFNQPYFGWSEAQVRALPTGTLPASFTANYVRGDVFVIKQAAEPLGVTLAAPVEPAADRVEIRPAIRPPFGQLVLLSRCTGGAVGNLFQVANQDSSAVGALYRLARVGGLVPGNLDPSDLNHRFTTAYQPEETELTQAHSNLYYVGRATTADGVPSPTDTALRRILLGRGAELPDQELVAGVHDLRIQYGLDSDDNGRLDRYEATADMAGTGPGGEWTQVAAVRIALIAYSSVDERLPAADDIAALPFDPTIWSFEEARLQRDPQHPDAPPLFRPPTRGLYRFFVTTVASRNRGHAR